MECKTCLYWNKEKKLDSWIEQGDRIGSHRGSLITAPLEVESDKVKWLENLVRVEVINLMDEGMCCRFPVLEDKKSTDFCGEYKKIPK